MKHRIAKKCWIYWLKKFWCRWNWSSIQWSRNPIKMRMRNPSKEQGRQQRQRIQINWFATPRRLRKGRRKSITLRDNGNKGTSVNACLFCIDPVYILMLECSECQDCLHYRCSNLPAYHVLNYSKTNRKLTCKRYRNNVHEMLKECIERILETKVKEKNE